MISFDKFPGGKNKALTMSHDDGVQQDRRLVDIFNKYGIKGTFHINAGLLDKPKKVAPGEISELYKGHEISAHGFTHQPLGITPKERIVNEIVNDRKMLRFSADEKMAYNPACISVWFTTGEGTVEIKPGRNHIKIRVYIN